MGLHDTVQKIIELGLENKVKNKIKEMLKNKEEREELKTEFLDTLRIVSNYRFSSTIFERFTEKRVLDEIISSKFEEEYSKETTEDLVFYFLVYKSLEKILSEREFDLFQEDDEYFKILKLESNLGKFFIQFKRGRAFIIFSSMDPSIVEYGELFEVAHEIFIDGEIDPSPIKGRDFYYISLDEEEILDYIVGRYHLGRYFTEFFIDQYLKLFVEEMLRAVSSYILYKYYYQIEVNKGTYVILRLSEIKVKEIIRDLREFSNILINFIRNFLVQQEEDLNDVSYIYRLLRSFKKTLRDKISKDITSQSH